MKGHSWQEIKSTPHTHFPKPLVQSVVSRLWFPHVKNATLCEISASFAGPPWDWNFSFLLTSNGDSVSANGALIIFTWLYLRKEAGYAGCLIFITVGTRKPPKLGHICSSKITRGVKTDVKVRKDCAVRTTGFSLRCHGFWWMRFARYNAEAFYLFLVLFFWWNAVWRSFPVVSRGVT